MSSQSPKSGSLALPGSPPPPHPDSKISPAHAIAGNNSNDEDRFAGTSAKSDDGTGEDRVSPGPNSKILWKDQEYGRTGRRPSVQFSTMQSEALLRTESPAPKSRNEKAKAGRRLSSPPPPPAHQQRVSFDTFANPDVSTWSYTLRSDHKDYDYSSTGRTFLVGIDENDYSNYALEWLLEEMVDEGDMVICLRVVNKDPKSITPQEDQKCKNEAQKLQKQLQANSADRKIAVILEYAAGKIQDNIMRMIGIYEANFLVVGTRGRNLNGLQGLLPGSVSKWCIQNSPIPVIVARKESKRKQSKAARQADPNRRSYQALLKATGPLSSTSNILAAHGHPGLSPSGEVPNLDGNAVTATNLSLLANRQTEAEAVARAIGMPTEYSASTILKRRSSRASATSATGSSDTGEGFALRREISGRSEDDGPDSPSPLGSLRDETEEDGAGGNAESDVDPLVGPGSGNGMSNTMEVPVVKLQRIATDLDLNDSR